MSIRVTVWLIHCIATGAGAQCFVLTRTELPSSNGTTKYPSK